MPRQRVRRAYSSEEKRELMLRRSELTVLAQHPAWPVLEAVLAEKGERIKNTVAVEVLGGADSGPGMSAERQAFLRGFVRGMGYVLVVPLNAEARLEELLRDQSDDQGVASG